jgi:hypothetical protein
MNYDYLVSIEHNHCFLSFSATKRIFYISLWNGVLRDGKIDDIDIQFLEAKNPMIVHDCLSFNEKNINLSEKQLNHLLNLLPEIH